MLPLWPKQKSTTAKKSVLDLGPLALEWQALNNSLVTRFPEDQRLILHQRNKVATEILQHLHGLIWRMVRKRVHNRNYQDDAFVAAQQAVVCGGLPAWNAAKAKKSGATFVSYIHYWIYHGIIRMLEEESELIYVPSYKRAQIKKKLYNNQELSESDRPYAPMVIELDAHPDYFEDANSFVDAVFFRAGLCVHNELEAKINEAEPRWKIAQLGRLLEDRRQQIIFRRLTEGDNLREIGRALGVSSEYVRQIRERIFELLRTRAAATLVKEV